MPNLSTLFVAGIVAFIAILVYVAFFRQDDDGQVDTSEPGRAKNDQGPSPRPK